MQDRDQVDHEKAMAAAQRDQAARYGRMFQIHPKGLSPDQSSIFMSIDHLLSKETPVKFMIAPPTKVAGLSMVVDPVAKKRVWDFWRRFVSQAEDSSLTIYHEHASGDQQGRSGVMTIGSANDLVILKMMVCGQ